MYNLYNSLKVHNNPGLYHVKGKYSSHINTILEHCESQDTAMKILKRALKIAKCHANYMGLGVILMMRIFIRVHFILKNIVY